MRSYTVNTMLGLVLQQFGPKTYHKLVGEFLDRIEAEVAATPGRVDDLVVTPLVAAARRQLEVPDPMEAQGGNASLPPAPEQV